MDDSPPIHRVNTPPVRRSPRLAAARRITRSPVPQGQPRARTGGSGLPHHMIWDCFERFNDGGSKARAVCNFCKDPVRNAQPGRSMKRHIKQCRLAPFYVKRQVCDFFPERQRHAEDATGAATGDNDDQPASTLTPAEQQKQFEMALASMFFLCALPFVLIESESFRAPFKLLAPEITFPSRPKLTGDLLRNARDRIRKRVIALIRDQNVVSIVKTAGRTSITPP